MSESRLGIGQHRSTPGLSGNNGQRERRDPAAVVGPNLSGGEMQNTVPGSQPINSGVPFTARPRMTTTARAATARGRNASREQASR